MAQKQITLNGREYVIQDWTSSQAVYWGKTIIDVAAGGFDGITGASFAETSIDWAKVFGGAIRSVRPAEAVKILQGILRDSLTSPVYSDKWFDEAFGPHVHWLIELCVEIVTFQFREAAPALKKKAQIVLAVLS